MARISVVWNGGVIALSIFVAFMGSYVCVTLYEQYRISSRLNKYKLASPSMVLVLLTISVGGVAIWCMHFIGMSAVTMYSPTGQILDVSFRIDLTLISLAVVLVCTYLGIYIGTRDGSFTLDREDVIGNFIESLHSKSIQEIRKIGHVNNVLAASLFTNLIPLIVGGMLIASGVCVMHYIGMMAMVFDGEMEWDYGIVTASVLIALVAATAALWIMFRLLAMFPNVELLRIACAVVMAIAVNGMHYTGMGAAKFIHLPNKTTMNEYAIVDSKTAENGALLSAVLFLSIAFILVVSDLRVWYHNLSNIHTELDSIIEERLVIEHSDSKRREFYESYLVLRCSDGTDDSVKAFRRNNGIIRNKPGSRLRDGKSCTATNAKIFPALSSRSRLAGIVLNSLSGIKGPEEKYHANSFASRDAGGQSKSNFDLEGGLLDSGKSYEVLK